MTMQLKNLRIFIQEKPIFRSLTLTIAPGEIVTIMGPSGCGKSTLLSAISGSIDPIFTVEGHISLNGKNIMALPMEERNIGILFQDDLLFPHMTIGNNLAFAINETVDKKKKKLIIQDALKIAGLEGFENRDPMSLSGGQKARVSLLTSLIANPSAILMDEPFSKLDQALKTKIRQFIYSQIKRMNIPALLVTHDPKDCQAQGKVIEL